MQELTEAEAIMLAGLYYGEKWGFNMDKFPIEPHEQEFNHLVEMGLVDPATKLLTDLGNEVCK